MYQRIPVAIDGSKTADLGLDPAVALDRRTGGRLRAMPRPVAA